MDWLQRFWAWLVGLWHRLAGPPALPPSAPPPALDARPEPPPGAGGSASASASPAGPDVARTASPAAPIPSTLPSPSPASGRVRIYENAPAAEPAARDASVPADAAPATACSATAASVATPSAAAPLAAASSTAAQPAPSAPAPSVLPQPLPPSAPAATPAVPPREAEVVPFPGPSSAPAAPAPAPPPSAPPAPPLAPSAAPASGPAPDVVPWWKRLTGGLSKTSNALSSGVTELFSKRKLDDATLDDLEDLLIGADLGAPAAGRIRDALSEGRFGKDVSPDELKSVLATEVERVLAPVAKPLALDAGKKPFVVLFVGVNGAGKTTTVGKLAERFRREGRSVVLAAADTFRAAAIDQLKVWGQRAGATVVAKAQGSDAAGLAFEALERAKAENADVLLVDTAGRLQNRTELMDELSKIVRVMRKLDATAPHAVLLVLDATVGQNALSQAEAFQRTAGVTGLVMTKLDGTARGGILVALAERFKLPVHFIGVGEGAEDLAPFQAGEFARAVAGLEPLKETRS